MKICRIYRITNKVTNNFYIGSSKDVKKRWSEHKRQSTWKQHPNNQLYKDMQKYGTNKFSFQILEEVEEGKLKEVEQQFIETLKPTYNQMNAKGLNIERQKEYQKDYEKSDKRKKQKKEYEKTDKRKKYKKEYNNQLCFYNCEIITLTALKTRFSRAGFPHPILEAKKYLLNK